jgi:acyl-CoA hydrolase
MEVLVSVCAETPSVGAVTECGDAFITVVLVDAKGAPLPVPVDLATPVDPAHPDARRARGAAARRDERLAMRAALSEKEARRPSLDGSVRGGGAAAAAAAALAGLGVTGDGDAAVEAAARAMERRFVDA